MLVKINYKRFNESKKAREDYILLIKDIIRLIKYYDLKCNHYGNKLFCYNQLRRFKYIQYLDILKQDLKRELTFYKWFFNYKRIKSHED